MTLKNFLSQIHMNTDPEPFYPEGLYVTSIEMIRSYVPKCGIAG